jgi:hypothetical protein
MRAQRDLKKAPFLLQMSAGGAITEARARGDGRSQERTVESLTLGKRGRIPPRVPGYASDHSTLNAITEFLKNVGT